MKPNPLDYVVIIFKNTLKVEGLVDFWSEKKIILQSPDRDCVIVVNNFDDVLAYKIIKQKPERKTKKECENIENDYLDPNDIQEELIEDIEKELPTNEDGSFDVKSIVELRKMQAEQDRQIIINKLKSHQIGEVKAVKYDFPRFSKK